MNYLIWTMFTLLLVFQFFIVLHYRKLNKNKDSYVAALTHDLKSPSRAQLNIINSLLKGEYGTLTQNQKEMIELMRGSTKYMTGLVCTILDKYKYDHLTLKLNFTGFNLCELINFVCCENFCLLKDKNQNIVFDCPDTNLYVYADKLELERVIFNLLSNALTYGFKNSTIKIHLEKKEKYVNFSISNYSYPIEEKYLKTLFNEFKTYKNNKYNPLSSGLGLYVSKKIIQMHKGYIYAKSSADGVITFGFIIPVKEECGAQLSV